MTATRRVPRLAVLWCPHWPVVVAGAHAGEPVVVLHANRVVAHSLAAADEGITIGMRRRESQARCPQVRIVAHEPERDARAFDAVVQAVAAKVPRLELTEPGTLTFLARGPSRYFGGEEQMAATIRDVAARAAGASLAAVGAFGLGVGDGRFAAALAARQGRGLVVSAGAAATRDFLAPHPVSALVDAAGVDPGFVDLLHRLGLHRLGQVAELPEADLMARFGPIGSFAHRLASGGDDRLPGTHDPPAGHEVQQSFDEPVHHSDVLVFVARQLADALVAGLAAEGRVCTRLLVRAETEHGERSERLWYRSSGLAAAAMVERVRWQLDGWSRDDSLTAGVTLLRLDPVEVRADDGVQQGLWGGRTQADDWALRAVSRLAGLVGEQQVLVPAAQGGRHPHEAYRWIPAVTADLADPSGRIGPQVGSLAAPWPGRLPSPSPAVVHTPALEIDVTDRDGRPVAVSGRGLLSAAPAAVTVSGERRRVAAWAGPWPVEERWWDLARSRRLARLQVLTTDGRVLLVAVEQRRWLLVAEYA